MERRIQKPSCLILILLAVLTVSCTRQPALPVNVQITPTGAVGASQAPGSKTPVSTTPTSENPPAQPPPAAEFHWPGAEWTTADPESPGIDPQVLRALLAAIPDRAPGVTSLLIIRNGDLVLEEYFGSGEAGR